MAEKFQTDGLTIAPGVVETILAQTVLAVEGVARVGSAKPTDGLLGASRRRNPAQGILLTAEDGLIHVDVRIHAFFGFRLQEVAEQVRLAIAETLEGQIGVGISAVDVYIDGIVFPQ